MSASLLLSATHGAFAVDLTVSSIEVNQAIQFPTTKLFGNNITWVRVKVGIAGSATPVAGVDAALRLSVDGVQLPGPPIFSLNGPITAPLAPNSANLNDTINFTVLPPISAHVDFVVEVNPSRSVIETDFENNSGAVNNKNFECRDVLEVAYVPINYTYNGAGLPSAMLMEPGIGDNFLRAIYHPSEWNYHKSPLPPLTWTQNINGSSSSLLNTLNDIRVNQIPNAGYPQPDFVYAWLPGNPYSGNGQAGGIPSSVAFGNTELSRFQRTFAHELGHCFGRLHNNLTINTIGVDVERHLKDTQNLAQLFGTTKKDVMVAGQLTNAAFVAQSTFTAVHDDARMACPPPGVAGAEEATVPVLRVSGVVDNQARSMTFDPVTRIASAVPTANDPKGDITVMAFDALGAELAQVTVNTATNLELCVEHEPGAPVLAPTAPLYVLLPETIAGTAIHQIKLFDHVTQQFIGDRVRSANAPNSTFGAIEVDPDKAEAQIVDGAMLGAVTVNWTAGDADGDSLVHNLFYSPNGGESWLPIGVNLTASAFEFDTRSVPSTQGATGMFKLVTSDGMNVSETGSMVFALGGSNPPQTFLLAPNDGDVFPQEASIAFHAASWDLEDLMLSGDQIVWTSNLDGPMGTGHELLYSDLSPGVHKIKVTATDSGGSSTMNEIAITITPRVVISPDCNDNGVLDSQDIALGGSADINGDGVPDECKVGCPSDVSGDGTVGVDDLLAVISSWGSCASPCPPSCPADVDGNCAIDVDDLLTMIDAWGPCQ